MTLVEFMPWIAVVSAFGIACFVLTRNEGLRSGTWLLPACICALFTAWSLWTVLVEGLTGVWPEHTRNMWGNQIWFDLLIAIVIGWSFLAREAKILGMNRPAWLVFVFTTGCIGLSAMMARVLYLKARTEPLAAPQPAP